MMKHKIKTKWIEEDGYNVSGTEFDAQEKIEENEFKEIQKKDRRNFKEELELMRDVATELAYQTTALSTLPEDRVYLTGKLKEINDLSRRAGRISRRRFMAEPIFRFVIYFSNADRTTVIKTSTDVDMTPEYVKNNYELIKTKLRPFLLRELRALCRVKVFSLCDLTELILKCIMNIQNSKSRLQATLKSMGIKHPLSVFNSVMAFVGANQSLKLFDSNSRYVKRITLSSTFVDDNDVTIMPSRSNEDNDVMIVDEPARPSRTQADPLSYGYNSDLSPFSLFNRRIREQYRDMLRRGRSNPAVSLPSLPNMSPDDPDVFRRTIHSRSPPDFLEHLNRRRANRTIQLNDSDDEDELMLSAPPIRHRPHPPLPPRPDEVMTIDSD
ncbi:unnamed protein product [Bursaphelenchus okinawaensis]|uniref:Uncharacterized protein n=1 Tax=Bursaphelenchus okinawaensis TaxID=465554 RepID=A0A811KSZ9_9BILA|nr:unnamed protein product [Bursaphelenchus okinawaensis]CAG9112156.1 unnamed protein product [Bursaphelenchus okinawaensis]